jgi:hypothetical protein
MSIYVDSIKKAFDEVDNHKLSDDVFNLHGMSGKLTRIFYNNLLSNISNARYLEIGVFLGSTFISALYKNSLDKAVCIDNFQEFKEGSADLLHSNVLNICGNTHYTLIEGNSFHKETITKCKELGPYNVYMYDGNHSEESHYNALIDYKDCLDDIFVYICDDWNWEAVKKGTNRAIEEGFDVIYKEEVTCNYNTERSEKWWNGMIVLVLQKK